MPSIMRTLTISAINTAAITVFPNGCRFDNNDVFLGSGIIESIEITQLGILPLQGGISAFDGIVAATGLVVVGGTPAALSDRDAYRVIAANAAATNGPLGDPISFAAPNAQLTACRQIGSWNVSLASQATIATNECGYRINVNHVCPAGMAVFFNISSGGSFTMAVNFIPHTSGGARRRRSYRPGLTAKTQQLVQAL